MQRVIAQLKKLRGKSARELRVRGRQEMAKRGESILGWSTGEMSDAAFLREIKPEQRNGSAVGTATCIAERIQAASLYSSHRMFLPAFGRRDEVTAMLERRFPDQRRALIERAERAIEGRFDLLGLADISFGDPIDWHLEPESGRRAPLDHWSKINYLEPCVVGDKKVTWELNRHQHFVTLGQAYWVTGDERFAAAFVSQAVSWMDNNPPNRGINWASSLEVAFRSIAWVWALHLFAGSHHLSPKFVLRLLKHLTAHGRHIESYMSHYFSPNTHLTGEALGLFYLGTTLPELRRASAWRKKGLAILLEQLPIHVRRDGVYFEQATYYHRYTADFYTHLVILARASNTLLPLEVEEKLAGMMEHLMWITRPDGTSPLVGDDDGGRLIKLGERSVDDFRDTLATGATLFGRGDWKFVAGSAAVETLWLLGPEGLARYDEISGEPPLETSRAFDASGYYVMRDGWSKDSSYALIDSGPHGAISCGHAHSDALAFEFAALGKSWLVDPGTFTYTGDLRARDEFRETAAHNTVTVDGQCQSVPAGPFSWSHIARAGERDFIREEGLDYFEGSHDGYERLTDPVTHRRAVLLVKAPGEQAVSAHVPSYMIVRDTFLARRRHAYEIRYHLSPACSAVASGNRVKVTQPGGKLDLITFGRILPQARIAKGWVSRGYGQRDKSLIAVFEAEGETLQEFTTFIVPSTKPEAVQVAQHHAVHPSGRGFHITSGEAFDVVLMGSGLSAVECQSLVACGSLAWARFVNSRLVRACLINGHTLQTSDGVELRFPKAVRHCAIVRAGDRVEISVNGADRFNVALREPASKIAVNGASFYMRGAEQIVAFANDGLGWKLSDVREYGG